MRFAATLLAMAALTSAAIAQNVTLTVDEPVGVARSSEPVSSGVCFKAGEVTDVSKLTLTDAAGKAVPAQFTPMVTLEDGSHQWVLVDFQADVPAGGSAKYTVKAGKPAAPASPVKVTEQGGVYTLDSGAVAVVVDTSADVFSLIEKATVGGKMVAKGLAAEAMTCRDALDGNKLYHAGKPTKVEFDYRGPVRTTLMAEGPYVDAAGNEWLGYRVRVTVYAGSKLVRVEHSLRNSYAKAVRHAKVKDAHLRLGVPGAGQGETDRDYLSAGPVFVKHRLLSGYFSPTLHALSSGGDKLTMAVVPLYEGQWDPRAHRGYNPHEGGDYNTGDAGSWWLYDCAYKIDEYWLSFGGGDADLAKALDSKLYALAPGEYYSECEALGFGRFGTLDDEAATYAKWGWSDIEKKKQALLNNRWSKPQPGYHVAYVLSHADSETDDAEGMLLMALRTGLRGYWDAGLAWARFYANNFVQRIDFDPSGRRTGDRWNFKGHDVHIMASHQSYANGRTCGCHFYGGGAMDYYVLTGEKSLLLGCADLARYATGKWKSMKPGKSGVGTWGSRAFGRQLMGAVRWYQITRDAESKKDVEHMVALALNDPFMVAEDDYMFIDAPSSNGAHGVKQVTAAIKKLPRLAEYMKAKGLVWDEKARTMTNAKGESWKVYDAAGTWEQTYVQQGIHRWWRTTRDPKAAAYVVGFANYYNRFAFDDHCQQVGYIAGGINVPEKGMCLGTQTGRWDPAHDKCPAPGARHNGWYTVFGPDVAMRAYDVQGDAKYFDQAKLYWNRGSKRGYQTTKYSAADDAVGTFATHDPPKDDSILASALMWYLAPRTK